MLVPVGGGRLFVPASSMPVTLIALLLFVTRAFGWFGRVTPAEVLAYVAVLLVSGPLSVVFGAFAMWAGPTGLHVRGGGRTLQLPREEVGFLCLLLVRSSKGPTLHRVYVYDRRFHQRFTVSVWSLGGTGALIRRGLRRYGFGWVSVTEDERTGARTFANTRAPAGAIQALRDDRVLAKRRRR